MKNIIILLICLMPALSQAETLVVTPPTKITQIQAYSEYGSGDVLVYTELKVAGCDAFWFSTSNPGSDHILSMALAAQHSGTTLRITADSDRRWAGSPTGIFCHLYAILSE